LRGEEIETWGRVSDFTQGHSHGEQDELGLQRAVIDNLLAKQAWKPNFNSNYPKLIRWVCILRWALVLLRNFTVFT
jgi:hypothetical protein